MKKGKKKNRLLKKKFSLENNKIIVIMLVLVFLFHMINNIIFLSMDTMPTAWDSSWHSAISLSYYNKVTGNGEGNLSNVSSYLSERASRYPHFFHISSLPLTLIFGTSDDVLAMTNIFYLLLLIIFTYLLGRELYSKKVGILAAFIVTMYPMSFNDSRLYMIDYALMGLVVTWFYFLIKIKNSSEEGIIKNLKYALPLTALFIIGIFTKQIFTVFVLPSLIYVLSLKIIEFYKKTLRSKIYAIPLIIFIIIVLLLSIDAYLKKISGYYLINIIFSQTTGIFDFILRLRSFVYESLIRMMMSLGLFLIFLYSFFHIDKFKEKIIFFTWIFLSIMFLVWTNTVASGRYILPVLPAMAILSAIGIFSTKNKVFKTLLILFVIIFSLILFFDISYSQDYHEYNFKILTLYANKVHTTTSYSRQDWKINEILDYIHKDSKGEEVKISLMPNIRWFNIHNFLFNNYRKKYDNIEINLMTNPRNSDYILAKDGIGNVEGDRPNPLVEELKRKQGICTFENYTNKLIKSYPLPDNTHALIFKKINCMAP